MQSVNDTHRVVIDAPSDESCSTCLKEPSLEVQSSLDGKGISMTSTLSERASIALLQDKHGSSSTACEGPPRMIQVPSSPTERKESISSQEQLQVSPFAQLCYNQRDGSIVTMMETSQNGEGRNSRARVNPLSTPDVFPSIATAGTEATSSSLSYSSSCTLSTLTEGYSQEESSVSIHDCPIVLGTVLIPEIDNKNTSLLKEDGERQRERNVAACSRALKKLITFRALRMRKVEMRSIWGEHHRPMMTRFSREKGYEPL